MQYGDKGGANRILKIGLMTFGIIGLCGTLLLFFGAEYISNVILQIPETALTLVALSPAIFFVSIASVMRGYFNGKDRISATAKSQTLEQIFKTVLTVAVVEIIVLFYGTNVTIMAARSKFSYYIVSPSKFWIFGIILQTA
ncbi:MAG: oligosaccharide flippase family protein [Clostridia bacterium]|nr:oligosaccharide flippase family protein [Clostridia bacterium]